MAGFQTTNNVDLIRTDLWSRQIKELLLDDLYAMQWVRVIQDFPDGTVIHIPSIGEAETADFAEGQAIKYNKLDTGDFQFSFDQYKYSGHSISAKFMRDSYYSGDVVAAFVPREHRAIMEGIEARVLSRGPAAQTASNLNTINGGDHRWIGSGSGQAISAVDFAKARYSLTKANVPLNNLVAIMDPSACYTLETATNIVNNLSPMPSNEAIFRGALKTGYRYRFNIYGFDVYESNYLPKIGAETINGKSTTVGVANQFFSASAGDTLPIVGGFRQMPKVESKWNMDLQQTEYATICEYGFKLYRPENMVVVITDTNVVV